MRATLSALFAVFGTILCSMSPVRADEVANAKEALAAHVSPTAQIVQMFVNGPWALGAYRVPGPDLFYAEVVLYQLPNGSWSPLLPNTNKLMSAGGIFGSDVMVYMFNVPGLNALALAQRESDAKIVDTNDRGFKWLNTNVSKIYCDDGTHDFGIFTYYESQLNYDGQIVPRYHAERWTVTRSNKPICNPLKANIGVHPPV